MGTDSFTYSVSDGRGGEAEGTVWVTIHPVNKPPVAYPASLETAQTEPVEIVLQGSDPDGDELTYAIIEPPSHGRLSGEPPYLVYAPHLTFSGIDPFTFAVSDGTAESSPATVSITLVPLEDPSVLAPRIAGIELLDQQVRITCQGLPGGIYQLVAKEQLATSEWSPVGHELEADEGPLIMEVPLLEAAPGALYTVTLLR